MSLKNLVAKMQLTVKCQHIIGKRYLTSKPINTILESVEETPKYMEKESEDLEQKRNKSRLTYFHRNILHDRKPYDEPMAWFHNTLKYKRKILGKYGMEALGVSAGLAWPTPEELEDAKEYERVAFPETIQTSWEKLKQRKKKQEETIMRRQNKIGAKMAKMDNLIALVQANVAKKKAEAEAAKQRKELRLLEIRQKLIAEGTVTKEKVEEMLLKYEKEDKKKRKQAKKEKYLERIYLKETKGADTPDAKKAAESREESPAAEKPTK